jgi:hypothetical protein
MTTIADYIKKCEFVASNLLDEQDRIILANERKILDLNIDAFQSGRGSDGKILKNSSPVFKGVYTLATQMQNPKKIAGEAYDFVDTGDFISNLQIDMQQNLTKFDIFSTGTGSGEKSIFFKGYTNLFGLDENNTKILNYNIIYPEIMTYIKKYL